MCVTYYWEKAAAECIKAYLSYRIFSIYKINCCPRVHITQTHILKEITTSSHDITVLKQELVEWKTNTNNSVFQFNTVNKGLGEKCNKYTCHTHSLCLSLFLSLSLSYIFTSTHITCN